MATPPASDSASGSLTKATLERKKKRTKEFDFLSPAVFPGHKTSLL